MDILARQVTDSYVYSCTNEDLIMSDYDGNVLMKTSLLVGGVVAVCFDLPNLCVYLLNVDGNLYSQKLDESITEKKLTCDKGVRVWINHKNNDLMILTSEGRLCVFHDSELCYSTNDLTKVIDGCIDGDLLMYSVDGRHEVMVYNYKKGYMVDIRTVGEKPSKILVFDNIISICTNNFIYLKTGKTEHHIVPKTIRHVVDYFVTDQNLMILTSKGVEMWEISKSSRLLTVFGLGDTTEIPKLLSYISDISVGVMFNSGKVELIITPDNDDTASVDSLSLDLQDIPDEGFIEALLTVSVSKAIK